MFLFIQKWEDASCSRNVEGVYKRYVTEQQRRNAPHPNYPKNGKMQAVQGTLKECTRSTRLKRDDEMRRICTFFITYVYR